jgi:P-type conjugative transfer protein TrbJ
MPLTPAHAQFGLGGVVFDPKNLAQSVLNYKKLISQLTVQTEIYAAQVNALRKLSQLPIRNIQGTIATIDATMRQGASLGYSLSNVDAAFRQTFPDTTTAQFNTLLHNRRTAQAIATLRSAIDAAQQVAQTVPGSLAQLQLMKQQLVQSVGHEQALEVNGAASVYGAEELTLLRQQLAAQTNAQVVYFAHELTQRAQADANERAFFAWLATPPKPAATISYRSSEQ